MDSIPPSLSEAERTLLLTTLNNTEQEYPRHATLPQLFEAQAQRWPEKVAVRLEDETLTYAQLNACANGLAQRLQQHGVQTGTIVGLLCERSLEMIIGMIAILKAGGAYLPIDPTLPTERIHHMLKESAAPVLLCYQSPTHALHYSGSLLNLEDPAMIAPSSLAPTPTLRPEDLAYVIYTSGSTGLPKGVMCTHRNVIRLVCNTTYINLSHQDRILQISNFAFDGSVFDIFGALLNGAELVLIHRQTLMDVQKLAAALLNHQITQALIPTALFNLLVDFRLDALQSMQHVMIGSEAASVRHVRKAIQALGPGRITNLYGPTECGVCATFYHIETLDDNATSVPIGKPLPNTCVYVLNETAQLLPYGQIGELYIGGEGLANGYLQHPDWTDERFAAHAFVNGKRLYRTGDRVRWLPDGNLEFLGRIDRQVKLRGYRIELEEIEHRLLQHPQIHEAALVVRQNPNGADYLCAYLAASHPLTSMELRAHLAQQLPDYMVPAQFILLEKLPRTSNGKIAYPELPPPSTLRGEYQAPQSDLERRLTSIWENVLQLSPIGISDPFFELGGHSIQVIQLAVQMEKAGFSIRIEDILHYQTIQRIAAALCNTAQPAQQPKAQQQVEQLFETQFSATGRYITYHVSENTYRVFHYSTSLQQRQPEIEQFFCQQVPADLLPHYFCPTLPDADETNPVLTPHQFAQLLNLNAITVEETAQQMEQEWQNAETCHNDAIRNAPSISTYPLGPLQYLMIMIPRMPIGNIFYFNQPVDITTFNRAFAALLKEQGVLRSILEGSNGQFYWNEHDLPEQVSVPVFDLSHAEPTTQQALINRLAVPLYERGFGEQSPLYRIALIKKNFSQYLVLFSADHILYDGVSEEIMRRGLHEWYQVFSNNQEPPASSILPFSEYVSQMQNSPRNIDEDEIIRLFDLEAYREYKQKVEAIAVAQRTPDLKVTTLRHRLTFNQPMEESDAWELAFAIYITFLGEYFGFDRVPLRFLSYGRRYQENNYFSTLGLLVDMIPMVVPVQINSPQQMAQYAYEKIGLTAQYWINFHKINFDMFFQQKWLRVGQLIAPETLEPVNQMIMFNYLGRIDQTHPEQAILREAAFHHQQRDTAVTIFYAEVFYTGDGLEFIIYTTIEHDPHLIQTRLQDIITRLTANK